ncbi:uncharacterized protein [Temnothorax nylanderi]|uniref:uncharacterized protein n=1 Tax=Temnothorax nylanderi TaxID=102681 RepID=UPI003A83928B
MAMANPSPGCVPSTFNIEQFDPSTSQWNRWLQRFEGALSVFKVTEGSKVAYLLHYIGALSFDMLSDRLDPENPYEQSYEQITTLLQEFYEPTPLEIVENFRFHQRKQEDGETIQQFIAALHKLSVNCKMGSYLKTALRNQLVFGVSNKRIQSRLLEVKDLTFDKACQIAITMELSEKGGVQLQAKKSTGECLQVEKKKMFKPKGRPEKKQQNVKPERKGQASATAKTSNSLYKANASNIMCYRCGDNHFASKCTLSKEIACHSCGKKGHLNKVCFSRKENVRAIEDVCMVEHIERRGKFEITLQVNRKPVTFEVDSGAAVTLDNAKPIFVKARPVPFKLRPLVEKEINSLVEAGILVKVTTSEWATPVVPVLKKNNTVRLCGDFSVTLNPNLVIDKHPVPTIEELFSSLAGGIKFSKIDLKDAYLQLKTQEEAFITAKKEFKNENYLVHFNPKLPLILATDASSYGVGAVLSHRYPDGTERVILYASQTLSDTQKKYSQIDKEAYAIIFGIKKFYQYLYANEFTLITDHRPLVQIFNPTRSLPICSALRMQHYALFLRAFNYKIVYRQSKEHGNADCLSRLPIPETSNHGFDVADAFEIEVIENLPITMTPYNPATNGQAERFVQTMKNALQRMSTSKELVQLNLQKFLLQYRRTPHTTTNKSPSELMFGRQIRSRLDFLKPLNLEKSDINSDKLVISLVVGQRVACRDYLSNQKWRFGRVKEKLGKLHYLIHLDDGRDWRRHTNQIRKIGEATPNNEQDQIDTDCGPPPHVEEGEVEENREAPVQEQEVEDVSREQSFYEDACEQPQERQGQEQQGQEQEQVLRKALLAFKAHILPLEVLRVIVFLDNRRIELPPRKVVTSTNPRSSLPPKYPAQQQDPHPVTWRLIPLDLPPVRYTRPPKELITRWDVRVRRSTSPRWTVPTLLSPLPPSPGDKTDQGIQTIPPARVHRGTQYLPRCADYESQTDSDWETSDLSSERATQTDPPKPRTSRHTQTEEPERPFTPPGTPPAWRRLNRWGQQPLHRTQAQPSITWSERPSP